jgi:hypothetical protein
MPELEFSRGMHDMKKVPLARTGFKRKSIRVTLPVDDDLFVTIERVLPRLYRIPAPSEARQLVSTPKADILRSESYRRFVSEQPCFGCGHAPPSQCAHANEGKGMALKVSDAETFPMCPPCHEALDNSRGMTRDERRELERGCVARMQTIAREAGRKEIA